MKYVYLIKAGDDHYKVGVAANIGRRIKALQTSNGHVVELVTAIRLENAYEIEKAVHTQLHEKQLSGGREWFKLTSEQAIELAILINKNPRIDISDVQLMQQSLSELSAKQKMVHIQMEDILIQLRYETGLNKNIIKAAEKIVAKEPKKFVLDKANERKAQKDSEDKRLLQEAIKICSIEGRASTSLLQRKLLIGYGRAARIMDILENSGKVSESDGARARRVLDIQDH